MYLERLRTRALKSLEGFLMYVIFKASQPRGGGGGGGGGYAHYGRVGAIPT